MNLDSLLATLHFELLSLMIILINPFALFLYLKSVMEGLRPAQFRSLLVKASFISFLIFYFFAVTGQFMFVYIFRINFESFRIFGGCLLFYLSLMYLARGGKSMIKLRENLDDTATEIALPFMVGAGTISVSILIGEKTSAAGSAWRIALALAVNLLIILLLRWLKDFITEKLKRRAFDNYMSIIVRIFGFMIGGLGIDMIIKGIRTIFHI